MVILLIWMFVPYYSSMESQAFCQIVQQWMLGIVRGFSPLEAEVRHDTDPAHVPNRAFSSML